MRLGRSFEKGFSSRRESKERVTEEKIEITFVESKETKPEKRSSDRILTSKEIEEKINKEITRFKEKEVGLVPSSRVIAYPSGLMLIFEPCFDGRPSLETFLGFYRGYLIIPTVYNRDRNVNMNNEEILHQLRTGRKISLQPEIFESTISTKARGVLPLDQEVRFVPSDEFAVGYYPPLKLWIVFIDQNALQNSERNVFCIFHELGHIPYSSIEDTFIAAALEEESKNTYGYDEFIKGFSRFISTLKEDLQKLKPELRKQIIETFESFQDLQSDSIKSKYIQGMSQIAEGVLLKQKEQAIRGGDFDTGKVIQRILSTLSVFSERMADARAAALSHRFRIEYGIDFDFDTQEELINFYREALKSYAEFYSDQRFITGFR